MNGCRVTLGKLIKLINYPTGPPALLTDQICPLSGLDLVEFADSAFSLSTTLARDLSDNLLLA